MNLTLLGVLLASSCAASRTTLTDWLPANTQFVVVVNDLERAWQVYQSAERPRSSDSLQERFAIAPEELTGLIEGEFLRAHLVGEDGATMEVALARVNPDIEERLTKIYVRLEQQQDAKITAKSFGSSQGNVIRRPGEAGGERVSVHAIADGWILFADSAAAADAILADTETGDRKGLARKEGFAETWRDSSSQLGGEDLAIAWYSDPWLEARTRERARENGLSSDKAYLFAKRHGITGIMGLGGSVVLDGNGRETTEARAYAAPRLTSSIQMTTHLAGTNKLMIPEWVSQAVTEVVVLHGNVGHALDHSGLLFDDGFAEGVEGTYEEVLLDLQDLLELDLKKDLYPRLGPHVYMLYGKSENRTWQPLVVAFEVRQRDRVEEILGILIADDPEATEVVLPGDSGRVWHVPGKRGGRDFVLGMLRGVAVYSNSVEFVKAAMRFDNSEAFGAGQRLIALQDRVTNGSDALPSMLIASHETSHDPTSNVHPLDFVFQDAKYFAAQESPDVNSQLGLPRRLTMLLARYELVVGFYEKHRWKFVAQTEALTEK